jgi:predicted O-linked N-acetylglucosamine transferase (SPINDLY family)
MHRPPQKSSEPASFRQADREFERAVLAHRSGQLAAAEQGYRGVLRLHPKHINALSNLGVILRARGECAEAVTCYRRAIEVDPRRTDIRVNLGNALITLGQAAAALQAYSEALAVAPDNADVRVALARALHNATRHQEALAHLGPALASAPNHVAALELTAEIVLALGEPQTAITHFERVIALQPRSPRALHNVGVALLQVDRSQEARQHLEAALALSPQQAETHVCLGVAVFNLDGPAASVPYFRRALELGPRHVNAWVNLGRSLDLLGSAETAEVYRRVLELDPDHLRARFWCHADATKNGHFEDADLHLSRLREKLGTQLASAQEWADLANLAYASVFRPLPDDEQAALLARLETLLRSAIGRQKPLSPLAPAETTPGRRLRIGYLSPNFRDHPVGHVTRSLFRAHRRDRFEIHGFSTAFRPAHPDYTDPIRAGMDAYHDLGRMPSRQAAAAIQAAGIDILVDLDGYMDCTSPPILAFRPAPVQVFWLGHAGGLGLSAVDYLIADRVVVPPGEERRYREKVVRLPDVYHCADRPDIAASVPSREACGLPPSGFVFCAFNNAQKILADTFDCWMRILQRVEGSCLWLSNQQRRPALVENLRRRASGQGVAPARLIFAERLPDKAAHLARHAHAGLFLDTAHGLSASTTALDALWAGVPMLTVHGDQFASRIASTLLHGLGLDDLICDSLADYEERAVRIAGDPGAAAALAERVRLARPTTPVFDSERFVRRLEAAYDSMWANHAAGQAPTGFDVSADAAGSTGLR